VLLEPGWLNELGSWIS